MGVERLRILQFVREDLLPKRGQLGPHRRVGEGLHDYGVETEEPSEEGEEAREPTSSECRSFNDVDAADAVNEIDQSAIVDGHAVGGHAVCAVSRIRQKMSDLPGTNGSAMSTRRRPCANQANGITVPRKRSDG